MVLIISISPFLVRSGTQGKKAEKEKKMVKEEQEEMELPVPICLLWPTVESRHTYGMCDKILLNPAGQAERNSIACVRHPAGSRRTGREK